jgi:hypothetical protein
MSKRDWLIVLAFMLVYGCISFINLGSTDTPVTEFAFTDEPVIFDLGVVREIDSVWVRAAASHDKPVDIYFSTDGVVYGDAAVFGSKHRDVFKWNEINLPYVAPKEEGEEDDEDPVPADPRQAIYARFIRLTCEGEDGRVFEFAAKDSAGNTLPLTILSESGAELIDEQDKVPLVSTYMDSSYFDEIYHPRSAWEFITGQKIYEWTHPPLGKLIMSVGLRMFGPTPFGWRFMGNVFGILMIPVIYMFAKALFKKEHFAVIATALFTFDFMHFAQTRLATIDTYITFFVILMYYFMYLYYDSKDEPFGRKPMLWLFLSGLSMGLGIACKWPGMYAGVGLAVLFVVALCRRYLAQRARAYPKAEEEVIEEVVIEEPLENTEETAGETVEANEPEIIQRDPSIPLFRFELIKTGLLCILFFIIIPAFIYALSYVPNYVNNGLYEANDAWSNYEKIEESPFASVLNEDYEPGRFLKAVVSEQMRMFGYHADLESTHPYSSRWFEWPISFVPLYAFSKDISDTAHSSISSFGNPAVWWMGIPAALMIFYKALRRRDKTAQFLAIGYLAQYLPWALISRTTYIYHYFPAVPFVCLMITQCIEYLGPKRRRAVIIYLYIVILLFALFYPVISGLPISPEIIRGILKWKFMPRWVFM